MELKLIPPVYKWQQWPRAYEPTEADLIEMSDEEKEAYWKTITRRHPASCVIPLKPVR